jgi:hypothetical protein
MKRALMVLAMAGIYVWIRPVQHQLSEPSAQEDSAEAAWASEGAANPSALV